MNTRTLPSFAAKLAPVGAVLFVLLALVVDAAPSDSAQGKRNRYIGAAKCKSCHSKAETGDQHGIWLEKTHSKAFETLAGDAAKKVAAEKGIADAQKDDACVKCHVTGFGLDAKEFQRGFKRELGVQCESCHGPGETHLKARFAAAAKDDAGDAYPSIPKDEIVTDITLDTCTKCHNDKSPTFKPFCLHERKAKIRHLNPKKPRTAEEKAALEKCTCEKTCVCKKDSDGVCRDEGK